MRADIYIRVLFPAHTGMILDGRHAHPWWGLLSGVRPRHETIVSCSPSSRSTPSPPQATFS
ncbi:hypothetical protein GCM10010112_82820 [Actinoplanes lobatus]|nr:hypothetical protein GCM10010112_82820 [Actinoplanes lobatus]